MACHRLLLKLAPAVETNEFSAANTYRLSRTNSASDLNSQPRSKESFLPPINSGGSISDTEEDSYDEIQAVLDAMFPPKEWQEGAKRWRQSVSPCPATRLDVINLEAQMNQKLADKGAKQFGLCPIRRELYMNLFDELIRQTTVNCAERGLMLLRIRDEIKLTLATYESLYQSAIAFGIRKMLSVECREVEAEQKLTDLHQNKAETEQKLCELESSLSAKELQYQLHLTSLEKQYKEEIDELTKTNEQLKANIDSLIQPIAHRYGDEEMFEDV